jgi:ribonuclease E
MAKKRMLINVSEDETRIALTENDVLVDLHVEQVLRGRTAGNIYRGTVVKVNPAFQAAFIDYGEPKNGFLSINDLNNSFFHGPPGKARIQTILRRGQTLMVQVLKEGVGAKGAALSTNVALPGRYLVLNPNSDRSGVSRKIEESEQRTRLKEFLQGLAAEGLGVIVRTAGIDRTLTDLKRDYTTLRREWKVVQDDFKAAKDVGLIYRQPGPVVRVLRDYFNEDVEEVWVDAPEVYQVALEYFKSAMPKFQKRLRLYIGDRSLFSVYKIEEKIEALDSAKVPLKSGGSIVMSPTEALVSIDVNSGKSNQESDIEETALRTNLEAAEEIARQLRLRNLGGLIVIDFIDMDHKANQNKVTAALQAALKHDKARTTVGSISQFGLLELSRQRIDMELSRGLNIPCLNCGGTGHVPTVQASANNVLRKLRELAAQGGVAEINGTLPLEHANFVLNHKREYLSELELEFGIHVHLLGDPGMPAGSPVRLEARFVEAAQETEERESAESRAEVPAAREREELGEGGARRRRRGRGPRPDRESPALERDTEPLAADAVMDEDSDDEAWADQEPTAAEEAVWSVDEPEAEEEEFEPIAAEEATEEEGPEEEVDREVVGKPQPVSAISLSHTLPTAFTLGRTRRRSMSFGKNAPSGEAIFESLHRDHKEHETVLIPMFKRGDAFAARAKVAESGAVFFESAHREAPPPLEAGETPENGGETGGTEEGGHTAPRRRRGRRSRRGGGGAARAGAQSPAEALEPRSEEPAFEPEPGNERPPEIDAEAGNEPEPGNEAAPGNEKTPAVRADKPARGGPPRRSRSRRRRPPPAAAAG